MKIWLRSLLVLGLLTSALGCSDDDSSTGNGTQLITANGKPTGKFTRTGGVFTESAAGIDRCVDSGEREMDYRSGDFLSYASRRMDSNNKYWSSKDSYEVLTVKPNEVEVRIDRTFYDTTVSNVSVWSYDANKEEVSSQVSGTPTTSSVDDGETGDAAPYNYCYVDTTNFSYTRVVGKYVFTSGETVSAQQIERTYTGRLKCYDEKTKDFADRGVGTESKIDIVSNEVPGLEVPFNCLKATTIFENIVVGKSTGELLMDETKEATSFKKF